MTFTNDDLKRLRQNAENKHKAGPSDVFALLARLEAAEALIFRLEKTLHDLQPGLTEAWRKAAGK